MDIVDRIFSLIQEKSVTAAEVAKDLNIPKSSFTEWKKGRSKPSSDAITKIADYFNVSTDYLLGRTNAKNNPTVVAAHRDENQFGELSEEEKEQLTDYLAYLRSKKK